VFYDLNRVATQAEVCLRKSKATPSSGEASEPTSLEVAVVVTQEIKLVFRKFDSNDDGKISSLELGAIFDSLGHTALAVELAQVMSEVDADNDGFISLEEFVDLNTSKVDSIAALKDLRHAFSVFDLDRNRSLSAEELPRVMHGLGEGVFVVQFQKMTDGIDQDGNDFVTS
ncbi:probable calcium-binding protein CML10, partial [Dendrobium catenatum]|uniref:probable calcium-binding protein CML10 n=1 Tax=Dendrobium catenatum TaxID=906689 RepID=UPI00109F600E